MKARKKPVVVEAWRISVGTEPRPDWMGSPAIRQLVGGRFAVDTPEGTMTAEAGDVLIRGVAGEIYPCKAHIFDAPYEVIE